MKYAKKFVLTLMLVAALGIALRVAFSSDHEHEHEHQHSSHDHDATDAGAHDHEGHHLHDTHDAAADADGWGGPVKHDLGNTLDPVSGAEVGEDHSRHAHGVYHGYLIHFADDRTLAQFKRQPIRHLHKLELEMTAAGEVTMVDASAYVTAPMPEYCPFCDMEMVDVDDVYILHRGFRIHFGCWGGCAQRFLKNPQDYYADYGLMEVDGELVLKE